MDWVESKNKLLGKSDNIMALSFIQFTQQRDQKPYKMSIQIACLIPSASESIEKKVLFN